MDMEVEEDESFQGPPPPRPIVKLDEAVVNQIAAAEVSAFAEAELTRRRLFTDPATLSKN